MFIFPPPNKGSVFIIRIVMPLFLLFSLLLVPGTQLCSVVVPKKDHPFV